MYIWRRARIDRSLLNPQRFVLPFLFLLIVFALCVRSLFDIGHLSRPRRLVLVSTPSDHLPANSLLSWRQSSTSQVNSIFESIMVAAGKALFGLTTYQWDTQDGSPSLAFNQNFPDPSILEVGGTWYAYSGASGPANTSPYTNVQVATSRNFEDWTISTSTAPLPTVGQWALQSGPKVWCPDVLQIVSESKHIRIIC
jgi:hypothetical protein